MDAYAGLSGYGNHSQMELATVEQYFPKLKVYHVRGVSHGYIENVPAAVYGVEKAYAKGDQVIISSFPGAQWVIMAQVPRLSARNAERAQEMDESQFDSGMDVSKKLAVTAPDENAISYRNIDASGQAEAAQDSGDIILQSSAELHGERSSFRLFQYGNILMQAGVKFSLAMIKGKNLFRLVAGKMHRSTAGYVEDIVTSQVPTTLGRATRTQTIKSQTLAPLNLITDKHTTEGYIAPQATGEGTTLVDRSIATRGQRTVFPQCAFEVDNDTGTIRVLQKNLAGDISIELGTTLTDNGVTVKVGETTSVVATSTSVTTTVGPNVLELSPEGLTANVASLDLTAAGPVNIEGAAVVIKGKAIDFKTA
jgi:hypothetical protein